MKKFTNVNEQLTSDYDQEQKIDSLVSEATKSFWDIIEVSYPYHAQNQSGSVTNEEVSLKESMKNAIKTWMSNAEDKPDQE